MRAGAMVRRGLLVAALTVAFLSGCASAPRNERSAQAGSAARILLILPFNVTAAMPSELDSMSHFVWKELEVYLRDQGKQLKTVSFDDARHLWISSIKEVRAGEKGSRAGYDEAARALVLKLAQYAEFDAVIVPALRIRKAQISGTTASWDGVERPLEMELNGRRTRRLPDQRALHVDSSGASLGSFPVETRLLGAAPAASLHAVVLDARGEKLQEARGGLELLVRVCVIQKRDLEAGPPAFQFETRTDLFADRDAVREGIAVALAPFLPPPPATAR